MDKEARSSLCKILLARRIRRIFSLSIPGSKTRMYIDDQEEHHRKRTFEEEMILFLKEYEIDYDERYLFNDLIALSGRIRYNAVHFTQGFALGCVI
jgi:hypothetical protein